MSERFEASLKADLAGIFTERLSQMLQEMGFQETLHIPEPDVTEFQRDGEVVSLRIGHAGAHQRRVSVESESVDVASLAEKATRATILEVARDLLEALPAREGAAGRDIEARLAELMKKES
ncbi:MAG: hypothetical protein ACYC66_07970 [Chloroflexota bacterium]